VIVGALLAWRVRAAGGPGRMASGWVRGPGTTRAAHRVVTTSAPTTGTATRSVRCACKPVGRWEGSDLGTEADRLIGLGACGVLGGGDTNLLVAVGSTRARRPVTPGGV